MTITDKYVLFWGGVLSNWATVPNGIIYTDGDRSITFSTSEHLFMYFKARYFNDNEIAEKIIASASPKDAKKLGRAVKGFDENKWEEVREYYMEAAIRLKVACWPLFKNELLNDNYKGKTFVEASPYDRIWGIGIGETNPDSNDETKWRGLNLLGKILTKVKKEIE